MQKIRRNAKHRWDLFIYIHTPPTLRSRVPLEPIPEDSELQTRYIPVREHKCRRFPEKSRSFVSEKKGKGSTNDYCKERNRKQWQVSPEHVTNVKNSFSQLNQKRESLDSDCQSFESSEFKDHKENGKLSKYEGIQLPPIESRNDTKLDERPVSKKYDLTQQESHIRGKREAISTNEKEKSEENWIVTKTQRIKPKDQLKLEGKMELETTFKAEIASAAEQRMRERTVKGKHSELYVNEDLNKAKTSVTQTLAGVELVTVEPPISFKRRHRPKTSLKIGGDSYFYTSNQEAYKKFVVVNPMDNNINEKQEILINESLTKEQTADITSKSERKSERNRDIQRKKKSLRLPKVDSTEINNNSKYSSEEEQTQNNRNETKFPDPSKRRGEKKTAASGDTFKSSSSEVQLLENKKKDSLENIGDVKSNKIMSLKSVSNQEDKNVTSERSIADDETREKGCKGKEQRTSCRKESVKDAANHTYPSNSEQQKQDIKNIHSLKGEIENEIELNSNQFMIDHNKNDETRFYTQIDSNITQQSSNVNGYRRNRRSSSIRPVSSLTVNGAFKSNECSDNQRRQRRKPSDAKSQLEQSYIDKNHTDELLKTVHFGENNENLITSNEARECEKQPTFPRNLVRKHKNESQLKFDGDMNFSTTFNEFFSSNSAMNANVSRIADIREEKMKKRDLFRTSEEVGIKDDNTFHCRTTYSQNYHSNLYCPAIDLDTNKSCFKYTGETGGHRFYHPTDNL